MKKELKNAWPTGKPHISFSEIKQWKECPYRHKLAYVDKIETFEDTAPIDTVLGVPVYPVIHIETRQKIFVSLDDIKKVSIEDALGEI